MLAALAWASSLEHVFHGALLDPSILFPLCQVNFSPPLQLIVR
jgi:hypothetical protein